MTVVERMRSRVPETRAKPKQNPPETGHLQALSLASSTSSIAQRPRGPISPLSGAQHRSVRYPLPRTAPSPMPLHAIRVLEIAAGTVLVAGLAAVGAWMYLRKRPSAEELEIARRQSLTQSGRLVDGTLLDVCEVPAGDGRILTMLLYEYRIGGADYECSQDVTNLQDVVDVATVRAGFPC